MLQAMLVDDNKASLQELCSLIDWSAYGIQIAATVHSGNEALDIFMNNQADIIISNVELPGMSGLDLLRSVKEIDRRVEFILTSDRADFDCAQQALMLGARDFILTPIHATELQNALYRILGKLSEYA